MHEVFGGENAAEMQRCNCNKCVWRGSAAIKIILPRVLSIAKFYIHISKYTGPALSRLGYVQTRAEEVPPFTVDLLEKSSHIVTTKSISPNV